MNSKLRKVKVTDVQADELWNFVGMKEKTKVRKGKTNAQLGDAYTFVAFERNTKLVITWHLGRRSNTDTQVFIEKLFDAVDGTTNLAILHAIAGPATSPRDKTYPTHRIRTLS